MGNRECMVPKKSHKITRYIWDAASQTIIDYVVMSSNLWKNVLVVKVITSENLGSNHRLLKRYQRKKAQLIPGE
jgi:hypothetical protein